MDFNVEQFVADYLAALKDNNKDELLKLITSLETDDNKAEALAGIIAALEADGDLAATAELALSDLKETQDKNTANVGADLKVEAPSITMTDPAAPAVLEAEEVEA